MSRCTPHLLCTSRLPETLSTWFLLPDCLMNLFDSDVPSEAHCEIRCVTGRTCLSSIYFYQNLSKIQLREYLVHWTTLNLFTFPAFKHQLIPYSVLTGGPRSFTCLCTFSVLTVSTGPGEGTSRCVGLHRWNCQYWTALHLFRKRHWPKSLRPHPLC